MHQKLESYFDRLWPITRSLTGNGNRESLKILSEIIPLHVQEIPSGTQCFDWTVPPEWNVREAWIKDEKGNKVIDFKSNNLHLLGYSVPVDGWLTYQELAPHIYTLPDQPELIPYLTSYYKERWGFCMAHQDFLALDQNARYQVRIDSELDPEGSMTIADAFLRGESEKEIFFSSYICHPSMANNELSGPLVTAFIYDQLKNKKLKYSYRFIFVPETIGSIYYLSEFGEHLRNQLEAGFVVTTIGDKGNFSYKRSRRGNALPDRAVELILKQTEQQFHIENFFPTGSDERQYCSPAFNLPVGSLMRTRYAKYKEYHTSGDNKDFICFAAMQKSVEKYLEVIDLIENNNFYVNTMPFCEPQLGKRGLYPSLGSQKDTAQAIDAMMWVLNLADGSRDLIDIIKASNHDYRTIISTVATLEKNGLLEQIASPQPVMPTGDMNSLALAR
jgi:aminopeptidase-like protein